MKRSFSLGKSGELFLQNFLTSHGLKWITVSKQDRDFWDLEVMIAGKRVLLEVKFDYKYKWTGNLAFEFRNSRKNKDSGIRMTKADVWVQILATDDYSLLSIPVKTLKDITSTLKPDKIMLNVGDGNADIMLFKRERLDEYFTDLQEFTTEELTRFLLNASGHC